MTGRRSRNSRRERTALRQAQGERIRRRKPMFSHIMVGSNDVDRSKKFYDALLEKEGKVDDKGRAAYRHKGSVFMISKPIDGSPASHSNGGTIGFSLDSPE